MMELLKHLPRRLIGFRLKFQPLRAYSAYGAGKAEDQSFSLAVHIRVTNKSAHDCSLVGFQIQGRKGLIGEKIAEVVCPPQHDPQPLPLQVPGKSAIDFWIHTYLPRTFRRSLSVGRLRLKIKDHTGKQYKRWVTAGPSDFVSLAQL